MALATVRSCAIDGVRALPVFVEVHIGGGLPSMSIVGLLVLVAPKALDQRGSLSCASVMVGAAFDGHLPLRP